MSDVKLIYLFFKVDKCSDLVAYGLAGCPESQSVKLLLFGWSPLRGCCSVS